MPSSSGGSLCNVMLTPAMAGWMGQTLALKANIASSPGSSGGAEAIHVKQNL